MTSQTKVRPKGTTVTGNTAILELPFGTIEEEVSRSIEVLKPLVPDSKGLLDAKHLARPPFRYLDDLIYAVTESTGFAKGLFVGLDPKEGENQLSREQKLKFMDRLVVFVGLGLGRAIDCLPTDIVAGRECERIIPVIIYRRTVGKCP